jgi:hypothetical protein
VIKPFKKLWVLEIPAKVKTCLWGLISGRTLTKENLRKRGLDRDVRCVFCARDESIDHLFFPCRVAKMIWSIFQCAYNTLALPKKMASWVIGWEVLMVMKAPGSK